MQIQANVSLKDYSSFHSGGAAEQIVTCKSTEELLQVLAAGYAHITILGYGTNVLISDDGLAGLTIVCRGGKIEIEEDTIIADAGAWWDDLVVLALQNNLWGVELMSGIPSSVGGAVMGNIAAYGQQIRDTLEWIELYDRATHTVRQISADEYTYSYRYNSLQDSKDVVVTRAAFSLRKQATQSLEYGSALRIAERLSLNPERLSDRRQIIIRAREQAGSLYDPDSNDNSYTAGSFFKNPVVPLDVAKKIIAFDETGKTEEQLLKQNKIHGGSDHRVSAAHVLLAAGFHRGQSWGNVRLHPEHILKIENTGSASSQEIYDVAQLLIDTAKEELGVTLEPEVKFLGSFRQS